MPSWCSVQQVHVPPADYDLRKATQEASSLAITQFAPELEDLVQEGTLVVLQPQARVVVSDH